jgi:hypothetical protein
MLQSLLSLLAPLTPFPGQAEWASGSLEISNPLSFLSNMISVRCQNAPLSNLEQFEDAVVCWVDESSLT